MPVPVRRFPGAVPWLFVLAFTVGACAARVTAPIEPPQSVHRGNEAFRYRDYAQAITAYRTYLDQFQRAEYTPVVFYKTALAQYRLQRYRDTLATLHQLAQRYPKDHWVQVDALRGDADRQLGLPTAALQAWDQAWREADSRDRPKLRTRIITVSRGLTEAQLVRARHLVTSDGVVELLKQQLALRKTGPGAFAAAMPPAPAPVETPETEGHEPAVSSSHLPAGLPPAEEPPAETAPAPAPLPAPQVAPRIAASAASPPAEKATVLNDAKVGCLLPLSGVDREFGERTLRALQLVFGADSKRLVVKDTASAPAIAVAMFEELASDPNVLVVIGPLRSDSAAAVAPRAEEAHVPTLLLSQRGGLGGTFALQAGLTRSRQVGTLLDYAMGRFRLRRFGMLYPNDPYGQEFAAAFREAVRQRGGELVGIDSYTAGTQTAATGTLQQWRERDNLQALFVPDTAGVAAQFAKFLQHRMPDVTLLGVHGWEGLAGHGGVNGVLFSDGFYANSSRPATRHFVEQFKRTYGVDPGPLEAQAYDAGQLADRALRDGAGTRSDIVSHMQAGGTLEGAAGALRVTPQGLQRTLFLLQVYDGKIEEVGGAG